MDLFLLVCSLLALALALSYRGKINSERLENLKLAADLKYKSDLLLERNARVADLIAENNKAEQVREQVKRLSEQAVTTIRHLSEKNEEIGKLRAQLLEKDAAFLVQTKVERKEAVSRSRSVLPCIRWHVRRGCQRGCDYGC
jgi:glutamate synthase domain-containing protein 1